MIKPYALLSFDPQEWDPKSLSYEVDVTNGVVNWVLIFGSAIFMKKTVPGSEILKNLSDYRKGRSLFLVEFDGADADGILPAEVAREIRASLASELTAA